MINFFRFPILVLFCLNVYASGNVSTSIGAASDTDDNSERNASLTGWYDLTDTVSIGLSQTEYRFDNQGDRDQGYSLASRLPSGYAVALLSVPDAAWPTARNTFLSTYGVDPESASVQARNAAIARLASSVQMNSYKERFDRKSFLAKATRDNVSYVLDLGVTTFKSHYATGTFDANWHYSESINYTFSLDRSLADVAYEYSVANCAVSSPLICDGDAVAIIKTTPSFAVDYSLGAYGIAAVAGRSHYSDDNNRNFLRSKWYFVISEDNGVSIYLKTRNFTNTGHHLSVAEAAQRIVDDQLAMRSDEYLLGSYYSPDNYGQYSAGLGLRKKVAAGQIVSGYIEQGRQRVDSVWSSASSWRLQYDVNFINTSYAAKFVLGQDSSAADYKYKYLQAQLTYSYR
jgi:hypothetical protein